MYRCRKLRRYDDALTKMVKEAAVDYQRESSTDNAFLGRQHGPTVWVMGDNEDQGNRMLSPGMLFTPGKPIVRGADGSIREDGERSECRHVA
jgi:hypothetical protein